MSDEPPGPAVPPRPPVPAMPPELALGAAAVEPPRVPGTPRATYDRLPTAPLPAQATSGTSADGVDEPHLEWAPSPAPAVRRRGLAAWALAFSIVGLAVALFVGWGFPLGLVGIVTAVVALRRRAESRALAGWAIVLGIVSVLYSAGWLIWALTRSGLLA